jgi:hypothetical protein
LSLGSPKSQKVKTEIPVKSVMKQEAFDRARTAAMARQVGVDFGASLTVGLAYIGDWSYPVSVDGIGLGD